MISIINMYIIYIYIQVANHWDIERCFLKDYFSLDRYTSPCLLRVIGIITEQMPDAWSWDRSAMDGTTNRSLFNKLMESSTWSVFFDPPPSSAILKQSGFIFHP